MKTDEYAGTRRITQDRPKSRAPSRMHFDRLEDCMREAIDDGCEFSRRQAVSLLSGMMELLEPKTQRTPSDE